MADGVAIAKAYVTIHTKMPGLQQDMNKAFGSTDMSKIGQSTGSKLASSMSKTLKRGLQVGAVGAAGALGTALVKGFGRLKAIETAQAKMRGIGFTSEQVSGAMDNALASVKGTAFGLGDAASVASQLMAANIKPGKKLEGVLTTVANNAALAGTNFDEMGSIFSKAATQANGVQNDVIGQLADKGIPIYKALGDQMGVTAGEVFKMASEGKIDFETFAKAAEDAAGTAAKEMGGTTTGAFDNMMAALGRVGAKMLEDVYPLVGPLFQDITAWLDKAGEKIQPFVNGLGDIGKLLTTGDYSSGLREAFGWEEDSAIVEFLLGVRDTAIDAFGVASDVVKRVGDIITQHVLPAISDLFSWIYKNKDWITPIAVGIGSAVLAFKLFTGAITLWKNATNLAKTAMELFSGTLTASPVGLIVAAIAGLVAGLVWFFTKTELGQKIWEEFTRFLSEAWENIKLAWDAVKQWFTDLWEAVKLVFTGFIDWIVELFLNWHPLGIIIANWDAIKLWFKGMWDGIKGFFRAAVDWVARLFQSWNPIGIITSNWSKISKWFSDFWAAVKGFFRKGIDWIVQVFLDWHPLGIIISNWGGISGWFSDLWSTVKGYFKTFLEYIETKPSEVFQGAVDAIEKIWNGIKAVAKAPVKFVVETVINDGLIGTINKIPGVNIKKIPLPDGFARGGILPGMSRMSDGDDQLIMARRGEGMMVSEALRTSRDRAAFLAVNAAGRRGQGFAQSMQGLQGFARGGLVNPLPDGSFNISQPWGNAGHNGIDLAAPQGTKVFAAAPGRVLLAGSVPMGGNEIYIQHTNGLGTRYSHLSAFSSRVGQQVKAGHVIGRVGSTGMSTGPHLHYMVHNPGGGPGNYGAHVNPAAYMGLSAKDRGAADSTQELGGLVGKAAGMLKKAFPEATMWVDVAAGMLTSGVKQLVDHLNPFAASDGHTKLYDSGGILPHGGTGVNLSGKPEAVLTNAEMVGYKTLMGAVGKAGSKSSTSSRGGGVAVRVSKNVGKKVGKEIAESFASALRKKQLNKDLLKGLLGSGSDASNASKKALESFDKQAKARRDELTKTVTGGDAAAERFKKQQKAAAERLRKLKLRETDLMESRGAVDMSTDAGKRRAAKLDRDLEENRRQQKKAAAERDKAAKDRKKGAKAVKAARKALKTEYGKDSFGNSQVSKQRERLKMQLAIARQTAAAGRAQIKANARLRTQAANRLKRAQETLDARVKRRDDYRSSVKSSIVGRGNVSGFRSVSGMTRNLTKQITNTKAFNTAITKLKKLGLGNASIKQLTDEFASSGSPKAAQALVKAGATGVKSINKLQSSLRTEADKLGKKTSGYLYGAGVDSQKGLVKGLTEDLAGLDKAGKKLADRLVKALKKQLKIKSPSRRVYRDVGVFVPRALTNAMSDPYEMRLLDSATRQLGDRAMPSVRRAPSGYTGAASTGQQPVYVSLSGVEMTLLVDGKPMKALVQGEIYEAASAVSPVSMKRTAGV